MSPPRTWTLVGQAPGNTPMVAGPPLADGEAAAVVELEAMLDLVEACEPYVFGSGDDLEDQLDEFLCRGGRLPAPRPGS